MNQQLRQLLVQLGKSFGKTTRWLALCEEQHANCDGDQIRLAMQVLAEPPTDTVAGGYAQWAKLHGAKDRKGPPYRPTGY